MSENRKCILVLAMGNDLVGDDGAGLMAARQLTEAYSERVDVTETGESGLALIELMTGYDRVLLIDAIVTGTHEPGSVIEFVPDDFSKIVAPSPHYAGIPEVFDVANRYQIPMPTEIRILGLEVVDPYEFREGLTPLIQEALPAFVEKCEQILRGWIDETVE